MCMFFLKAPTGNKDNDMGHDHGAKSVKSTQPKAAAGIGLFVFNYFDGPKLRGVVIFVRILLIKFQII